jgi:hypothetical protein
MEEQPETKSYYTPAVKKAIMTYREKNVEKYNEFQRNYYHTKKVDEEWNDRFKERCREANKRYRDKKRENSPPAQRGRPRKIKEVSCVC